MEWLRQDSDLPTAGVSSQRDLGFAAGVAPAPHPGVAPLGVTPPSSCMPYTTRSPDACHLASRKEVSAFRWALVALAHRGD